MTKRILCLLLISVFIQQARAQWQLQASGVTNALRDVAFSNAGTGYAVGDGGIVLKTTNGGSKWVATTSPGKGNLVSVTVIDSLRVMVTTAAANGSGAVIYESADGGNKWYPVLNDLPSFYATATPDHTLYSISSQIYNSTTAGRKWQAQYTLNPTSTYSQLAFSDNKTGMAAGNISGILTYSADFLRTINGHDWYNGYSFSFPNANGFCRFSMLGADSVLMFTNAYNRFVPGDNSQLILLNHFTLKTVMGSSAWVFDNKILVNKFPDIIDDCSFFPDGNGFAVSEKGTIYKITGLGKKVSREYSSKTPLHAIAMLDNNNGFAVGDNGLIVKRTAASTAVAAEMPISLSVYPNPAVNQAQVTFALAEDTRVSLEVTNATGKVVLSVPARLLEMGTAIVPLRIGKLLRGTYQISLLNSRKEVVGATRLLVAR